MFHAPCKRGAFILASPTPTSLLPNLHIMSEAGGRSELNQQARIHPTVVKKLLQLHWNKDPAADGAKINLDAAVLTAEYLRLFVIEAHNRAMIEAELDGDEAVEPQHIERVMLGMMLDF